MASDTHTILIAESGSTKTDWVLLQNKGEIQLSCTTQGLNPYILNANQLHRVITAESVLTENAAGIHKVFFYGAGCGQLASAAILSEVLRQIFPHAVVEVQSDITGAAIACCGKAPGIVMILGTGSNACLFDGKDISFADRSLGFILGDEGSGNWFGKKLLRDHFQHHMPADLMDDFIAAFPVSREVVLKHLYQEAHPNAYLASFFPFIAAHRTHAYIQEMIREGLQLFFASYISSIPEYTAFRLHAVGSVACVLEDEIRALAEHADMQTGYFLNAPIHALVEYIRNREFVL